MSYILKPLNRGEKEIEDEDGCSMASRLVHISLLTNHLPHLYRKKEGMSEGVSDWMTEGLK